MGLTTSALQIGRSALLSYQAALQVAGNNIANAGNAGYTRQSADLQTIPPTPGTTPLIGNGVALSSVRRNISEALEARLRGGRSDQASAQAENGALQRLESILNPLGDTNIGTYLDKFFNSLSSLQLTPEDPSARQVVIANGRAVADAIRQQRSDLLAARGEANGEVTDVATQADRISRQIAELNVQIVSAEAGNRGPAGGLRDQRDALLGQLSDLVGITTQEQPNGSVNVYVGNEPLVLFGESRGVTAVKEVGSDGQLNTVVRFADNNGLLTATSGQLEGLVRGRDVHTQTQLDRLDQFAAALIREVNQVHSGGRGLAGFSTLTGGNAVSDPTAALNATAAGLPFAPKTGSFSIDVTDAATGQTVRTDIHVDLDGIGGNDTTLQSLAAAINGSAANVTATVQPDGKLQLSAAAGFTFAFAGDTSNAVAALGLNTFFSGNGSLDINISDVVANSPQMLAAASSDRAGDGDNAGRLAALADQSSSDLSNTTLGDFFRESMGIQAVSSSTSQSAADAAGVIYSSLTAQRESVSGVNLDEEGIKLVTYQRSYEGAARYVTVINEMLQTLMGLIS